MPHKVVIDIVLFPIRPTSKVHLRLRLLHTECQWDYLHVFDGDSVFTQKLAAYT